MFLCRPPDPTAGAANHGPKLGDDDFDPMAHPVSTGQGLIASSHVEMMRLKQSQSPVPTAGAGAAAGAAGGAAAGSGAGALVAKMKQEISELIQDDIMNEDGEEVLDLLLHLEGGLGKSDSRVMRQITVNENRGEGGRLDAAKLYGIMKKICKREMDKAAGEEAN
mmetsp:Transcript_30847/g.90146  ORF Transcript_30847/g.90146 Transcript_30847/m.90146 type:complete len:165 (-) Transcript_30847:405-899(-)